MEDLTPAPRRVVPWMYSETWTTSAIVVLWACYFAWLSVRLIRECAKEGNALREGVSDDRAFRPPFPTMTNGQFFVCACACCGWPEQSLICIVIRVSSSWWARPLPRP